MLNDLSVTDLFLIVIHWQAHGLAQVFARYEQPRRTAESVYIVTEEFWSRLDRYIFLSEGFVMACKIFFLVLRK